MKKAADRGATASNSGQVGSPVQSAPSSRTDRLRLRAAWMYHVEEMTQSDIAERLGIGRVTVVRLLADARNNHEVKVRIDGELSEIVSLERQLEQAFGLKEAIVVPVGNSGEDVKGLIGNAAGNYLNETIHDGMSIGVGWGQTLMTMLSSLSTRSLPNTQVVSFLGAITKAKRFNPSEFAWQFASRLEADCHLMPAPALVDSMETRDILLERCGLGEIFERARHLDMAILSTGSMTPNATPFSLGYFKQADREQLITKGAVGDILYHFFNEKGEQIDHFHNDRMMSVPVEILRAVPQRLLISGGADKAQSLLGALRFIPPTTLITDELAAEKVLGLIS